jgi:MarR family protein
MNGHDDDQVARLLDAQLQRDAGLTFFDYMVLALLSGQPGWTMRVSALAAAISASLSRLSHVASRLEARGYFTRQRCPGPGRATSATLTGLWVPTTCVTWADALPSAVSRPVPGEPVLVWADVE